MSIPYGGCDGHNAGLLAYNRRCLKTELPKITNDPGRLSGSGGGIRGRASLASAAKQSFVANPRPPGYERGTMGRGFPNVLAMLRSYAEKVFELD
jgi:hypothetical protein